MQKILLLLLGVALTTAGEAQQPLEKPNILWITHEDLSPIYHSYGDEYANTPNLDLFAESSIMFSQAFSNAPICAPARSTLITGLYASSLGTQHLRSDIPIPEGMKILPELMKESGYYTTNNVKTDYNFDHTGRWDESSAEAHWRKGPKDKPFFSVFNHMITHEGPINAMRSSDTESLTFHHDPDEAQLPPYLPDSPRMREIWAHKYDLLAVFDQQMGQIIADLKEDGHYDNTIIFIFSDHGTGLPGHKRWLNNAGLQVPFLLYVPEKYKSFISNLSAPISDQKVGFVDFAPTVLTLAGAKVPKNMEGSNFLGENSIQKDFIYGYRDRADDCYEMSRSVYDGKYLYIRHFMPQLPYFQNAVIFNRGASYEEILRLKNLGQLPKGTIAMFEPKGVEELYDLENDPWEQNNLAGDPAYVEISKQLSQNLENWMLDHFDTGLLNEGDMMERAKKENYSVYEAVREYSRDDLAAVLATARMVGRIHDSKELNEMLKSDDSAIRFWALIALDAFEGEIGVVKPDLLNLIDDASYSVAAKAAEILIKRYEEEAAYRALEKILMSDYEPVVLQAAISVRQLGQKAHPLLPVIKNEVMPRYAGEIWGRYRNWSYPMFIGMALDQSRILMGENVKVNP